MGKFEPVSLSIKTKQRGGLETSGTDAKRGSGSGSRDCLLSSSQRHHPQTTKRLYAMEEACTP